MSVHMHELSVKKCRQSSVVRKGVTRSEMNHKELEGNWSIVEAMKDETFKETITKKLKKHWKNYK